MQPYAAPDWRNGGGILVSDPPRSKNHRHLEPKNQKTTRAAHHFLEDSSLEGGDDSMSRYIAEAFKLHAAVKQQLEEAVTSALMAESPGLLMDGRSSTKTLIRDLLGSASENLVTDILRSQASLLLPPRPVSEMNAAGTSFFGGNKKSMNLTTPPKRTFVRSTSSKRERPSSQGHRDSDDLSIQRSDDSGSADASCNTGVGGAAAAAADESWHHRRVSNGECISDGISDVSDDSRPLKKRLCFRLGVQPGASSAGLSKPSSLDPQCTTPESKPPRTKKKASISSSSATRVGQSHQALRYCQLCSRAHAESDFDPGRKSCRIELMKHAERRRIKRAELRRQREADARSAAAAAAAGGVRA